MQGNQQLYSQPNNKNTHAQPTKICRPNDKKETRIQPKSINTAKQQQFTQPTHKNTHSQTVIITHGQTATIHTSNQQK